MTSYPNTLYLFALYQGTKPHHYIFEDYHALPTILLHYDISNWQVQ